MEQNKVLVEQPDSFYRFKDLYDKCPSSCEFEGACGKRDHARNRLRALFVIGNHPAADAKRARCGVERVGLPFAPLLERDGRHGCTGLFLSKPPQCVSAAMSISSFQTTSVFLSLVPANTQSQRLLVGRHCGDAWQNSLGHCQPRSLVPAFQGQPFLTGLRPRARLGDLAGHGVAGNHR